MRTAIKVTDQNELTVLDLDAPEGSLKVLQDAVEGNIERIEIPAEPENIDMWVNEEFLFTFPEPRPNPFATFLYESMGGGEIQGNVLFTGGADAEGNTLGLNDLQAAALKQLHALHTDFRNSFGF